MPILMPEEKIYEIPPAGAHTAICIRIVDLGTQTSQFGAKPTLWVGWELADERTSEGKPFAIGRHYNWSSAPRAALRQDIEGWLGRTLSATDFGKLDLTDFLGRTCVLAIKHEAQADRTRAVINAVMKPPKGVKGRMSPSVPGIALALGDRPFDYGSYEALPPWLRDTIAKSPEYQAAVNPGAGPPRPLAPRSVPLREELSDEIPF
jgi:hypothetical protein